MLVREEDKQKALLFTEGGNGIGMGHIIRCLSLSQAFKARGVEPHLVLHSDVFQKNLLLDMKVEILDWINQHEFIEENLKGDDIAVIDSYMATAEICLLVSKSSGITIFIDDYNRMNYPSGIVINGSMGAPLIEYPDRPHGDYLLGPTYQILRKEFWSVREKIVRKEVESVMISFGGEDPRNLTPLVLKNISKDFPDYMKYVIVGYGFKNVKQIEAACDHSTKLCYSPGAKEMLDIMLDCDLAISAGGQTLGELARVGVPTIAVATAENQMTNITGWSHHGFIQYAGWWEDEATIHRINSLVEVLQNCYFREYIKGIGKATIDGNGAISIVEQAINRLKKHRKGLTS